MPDEFTDPRNRGDPAIPAATLTSVELESPYEVRRWCQRLVCTEAQLRAAVAKVGKDPAKVRAALRR